MEIDAGLPRWCETFSELYLRLLAAADTSHWELAPHAAGAVAAVERRALLTGNPPAVAHARMERLGVGELFPRGQGAFGCEREQRPSSSNWRASGRATGLWNAQSESETRLSTSRARTPQAAAPSA
jgi:hypothetical protein